MSTVHIICAPQTGSFQTAVFGTQQTLTIQQAQLTAVALTHSTQIAVSPRHPPTLPHPPSSPPPPPVVWFKASLPGTLAETPPSPLPPPLPAATRVLHVWHDHQHILTRRPGGTKWKEDGKKRDLPSPRVPRSPQKQTANNDTTRRASGTHMPEKITPRVYNLQHVS